MAQILLQVSGDKFYYLLNHNARRRPEIAACTSSAEEISLRCAQEFHRLNPPKDRGIPFDRKAHAAKLDRYHRQTCHIRAAVDGPDYCGGFVVLAGELLGLHNVRRGSGDWMLREAVALGADRLDTFDIPHLIDLYTRHGFREVLREPNHTAGQPDVVWMRRA